MFCCHVSKGRLSGAIAVPEIGGFPIYAMKWRLRLCISCVVHERPRPCFVPSERCLTYARSEGVISCTPPRRFRL